MVPTCATPGCWEAHRFLTHQRLLKICDLIARPSQARRCVTKGRKYTYEVQATGSRFLAIRDLYCSLVALATWKLLDCCWKLKLADMAGATPLSLACQSGHSEIVRLLLQARATSSANTQNVTPLLCACQDGHAEVASLLLEARVDIDHATNAGHTPLFMASQNGHTEVVRLLLAAKADTGKASTKQVTPLLIASQSGHLQVVRLLLEARVEIAELLLAATADVGKAEIHGETPLLWACLAGHLGMAGLLLEARADVDQARDDGASPLMLACQNSNLQLAKRLLDSSVDPGKSGRNGMTPMWSLHGNLELKPRNRTKITVAESFFALLSWPNSKKLTRSGARSSTSLDGHGMQKSACLPLPTSFFQLCSPVEQKLEPVRVSREQVVSPAQRYAVARGALQIPTLRSPALTATKAPPIMVLYEALRLDGMLCRRAQPWVQFLTTLVRGITGLPTDIEEAYLWHTMPLLPGRSQLRLRPGYPGRCAAGAELWRVIADLFRGVLSQHMCGASALGRSTPDVCLLAHTDTDASLPPSTSHEPWVDTCRGEVSRCLLAGWRFFLRRWPADGLDASCIAWWSRQCRWGALAVEGTSTEDDSACAATGQAFPPSPGATWAPVLDQMLRCTAGFYEGRYLEIRLNPEELWRGWRFEHPRPHIPESFGLCIPRGRCRESAVKWLLVPLFWLYVVGGHPDSVDHWAFVELARQLKAAGGEPPGSLSLITGTQHKEHIYDQAIREKEAQLPVPAPAVSGAVCIAGHPRSIGDPKVYQNLRTNDTWLCCELDQNPRRSWADAADALKVISPDVVVNIPVLLEGPPPDRECHVKYPPACNAQWRRLEMCMTHILALEQQRNKAFDWIIRVRTDMFFSKPVGNIRIFESHKVHMPVGSWTDPHDTFAMLPRRYAAIYFSTPASQHC
eukprot:s274_g3.t3